MTDNVKTEHPPLVSIVTVSFNCTDFLRKCLASLLAQDYPNFEIIAVDNGSDTDLHAKIGNEFPTVKWLRLEKNLGFAGGNNAGMQIASGKYIALINNDAIADPAWLTYLVLAAGSDTHIGAVASMVIDGNNPEILDSCGVSIALDGMSRQAIQGYPCSLKQKQRRVLAFSGCACLINREALKQAGYFDENFFAYCEDTDLSLRIIQTGWDIITEPKAKVTHYYSRTGGAFSLKKVFWIERNHYWVAIKNFPMPLLIALPFVTGWRFIYQVYALASKRGKIATFVSGNGFVDVARTILGANVAAIAGATAAFKARASMKGKQCRTGAEMLRLIFDFHVSIIEIIAGSNGTITKVGQDNQ